MNDFVRKHIDDLKALKTKSITDKTTQATIKRIDQIIKLYSERKIARVSTAEKFIKGSTSTDKKTCDKTFNEFKNKIDAWKNAPRLSDKMKDVKKEAKKK